MLKRFLSLCSEGCLAAGLTSRDKRSGTRTGIRSSTCFFTNNGRNSSLMSSDHRFTHRETDFSDGPKPRPQAASDSEAVSVDGRGESRVKPQPTFFLHHLLHRIEVWVCVGGPSPTMTIVSELDDNRAPTSLWRPTVYASATECNQSMPSLYILPGN
jgi:hypothetical protein